MAPRVVALDDCTSEVGDRLNRLERFFRLDRLLAAWTALRPGHLPPHPGGALHLMRHLAGWAGELTA